LGLEVYKFGGASVKDTSGFKNVGQIIEKYSGNKLLIVVSATGKTTNALQNVVADHYKPEANAFDSLQLVKENHLEIIDGLFDEAKLIKDEILDAFVEIDWLIEDDPHEDADFEYDQIVSVGEIVSTKILYHHLKSKNLKVAWLDVRDVIRTNNNYREAKVDWEETEARIQKKTSALYQENDIIVTQGFIASSSENFTTTLGREGSDFTASIFSYCLNANGMYIWKDVPGILTGDPRLFDNVSKIDKLSYREAIEMTYYGAKVIHPKTIKPVQNKSIPLHVKSFVEPEGTGSIISNFEEIAYPPIVVFEHNQRLLRISTKDFSFVAEDHLSEIFRLVAKHRIKIKMMKNTAVSFIISVDDQPTRLEALRKDLEKSYKLIEEQGLELMTIRHYNQEIINSLTAERVILFEERIPKTIQMVVKPISTMKLKE